MRASPRSVLAVVVVTSVLLLYGGPRLGSSGGMSEREQKLLRLWYSGADSVHEWGMGASTLIAARSGVARLTAVDSSLVWVEKMRGAMPATPAAYTLIHADIGPVVEWGHPADDTHKAQWPSYSTVRGAEPFDIYLVDGRFRVACAARALLHGRPDSLVLVHDFGRAEYQVLLKIADKVEQVGVLAVLRRKDSVTDEAIELVWRYYNLIP